ncbi:hypothetical protein PO124_13255 [Bacillus licheniformis]|nr:hypothetical protein [Bacillus licheniformis]
MGGYWIFKGLAPRPVEVSGPNGEVLMTNRLFQAVRPYFKIRADGLWNDLGHGSYMGPDYTAEALKSIRKGCRI